MSHIMFVYFFALINFPSNTAYQVLLPELGVWTSSERQGDPLVSGHGYTGKVWGRGSGAWPFHGNTGTSNLTADSLVLPRPSCDHRPFPVVNSVIQVAIKD